MMDDFLRELIYIVLFPTKLFLSWALFKSYPKIKDSIREIQIGNPVFSRIPAPILAVGIIGITDSLILLIPIFHYVIH